MSVVNACDLQVYYDAKQGGRVYMEDIVCIRTHTTEEEVVDNGGDNREFAFFAVFDGHGGPEAAQFAEANLKDEITRQEEFWSENDDDVIQAIKNGFISTHKLMRKAVDSWPKTMGGLTSTSGTTASVVILRGKKIFVAHVGDSCVVFGEQTDKNGSCSSKLRANLVTAEHKPDCAVERSRIEQFGGEVISKAGVSRVVWRRPRIMLSTSLLRRHNTCYDSIPFLAVSRALGDLWSYNAENDTFVVSPEPDVSVYELDPCQQRCLILATDGVWNMLTPTEAVNCVLSAANSVGEKSDANLVQPATALVQLALDRWKARCIRADNTSAIVILLPLADEKCATSVSSLPAEDAVCKTSAKRCSKGFLRRYRTRLRTARGCTGRTVAGQRRQFMQSRGQAKKFVNSNDRVNKVKSDYVSCTLPSSLSTEACKLLRTHCSVLLKRVSLQKESALKFSAVKRLARRSVQRSVGRIIKAGHTQRQHLAVCGKQLGAKVLTANDLKAMCTLSKCVNAKPHSSCLAVGLDLDSSVILKSDWMSSRISTNSCTSAARREHGGDVTLPHLSVDAVHSS